jgi:hypothetical protein
MFVLGMTWRDAMSIRMSGRPILVGLLHVNNSLLLFLPVIICANSGTYAAPDCATNYSAFTATHFRTDRGAYATANCAT